MRDGRACSAQTLRLDRTKPLICSAVELVPSQASPERNFKQSSPSAFGGPHLFGKCGALAYAIRDTESVSLMPCCCSEGKLGGDESLTNESTSQETRHC